MGDDNDAEPACKRRRRDADALATELLASGKNLSDADLLAVLSRWTFKPNKNRTNVLPEGVDSVYSDTLGLTRDRRGTVAVDAYTRERPGVFRLLCEWLKQRRTAELARDFPFTSISMNYNYAARLHRDGNNAGVSMTRSLGSFQGGELSYWPNDNKTAPLEQLRERDSVKIDTHLHYALFDGCRAHRVEAFRGERYSLVFFSLSAWTRGPKEQMPDGTVYPTEESLRFFSDMLAPARGQGNLSIMAAFGLNVKPQAICWPIPSLIHLPRQILLQVAVFVDCKKVLSTVNVKCSAIYTSAKRARV